MRVPDDNLAELHEQGFTILPGFVEPDTLAAAQAALWTIYPEPADYFADPDALGHQKFGRSQFAGIRYYPYNEPALDQLPVHADLIDAAERFLGTAELDLYKIELWAKYAGAIDYDQPMHRDYGNHTLVTPDPAAPPPQMTSFILLSDVGDDDGPTHVVPLSRSRDIPLVPQLLEPGELCDGAVPVTGPAGTLFLYRPDVFHRGTNFRAPNASRFALLVDYQARGARWRGKLTWQDAAIRPGWVEALAAMTPRQRDLFGFPPPGDAYWNERTRADVGARYPAMDMTPYQ